MGVNPADRSDGLGVVEPMRIPGRDALVRGWRRMPVTGQVFLLLALLDIAVRALGIGGLSLHISLDVPITLVTAFLPHSALILLPTVLLLRRPDAIRAAPLVFRGAVAVSLAELLSEWLVVWFVPAGPDTAAWFVIQLATAIAQAAGYVAIGAGLLALRRSLPSPTIAGLANVVAGVFVAAALTAALVIVLFPPSDYGALALGGQLLLTALAFDLAIVAFAYLARAIVLGTADAGRPWGATILASAAIALYAVDLAAVLIGNVLILANTFIALPTLTPGAIGLGWFGAGLAMTLLVVAFGLGLADGSVRMPLTGGSGSDEPDGGASPRWPAPGGEVPVFRPVERPRQVVDEPPEGSKEPEA